MNELLQQELLCNAVAAVYSQHIPQLFQLVVATAVLLYMRPIYVALISIFIYLFIRYSG